MRSLGKVFAAAVPLAFIILLCGFAANAPRIPEVPILVTAAPVYDPVAAIKGGERFPKSAQILILKNGEAEPLVPGFAASADPSVSFDAKTVLFAGKKTAADPWQIWEITLDGRATRRVIDGSTDVIRPLYLPGRRLVFSRRTEKGYFQLIAADLDGKAEQPLTYIAASAIASDVLADGRILFESGFPLGSGAIPELFMVYSDGSGVESYRCDHPAGAQAGRFGGRQVASGDIVFTHGSTLARFTSPLATEARIAIPPGQFAGGIAETSTGAWLVSTRPTSAAPYTLKLWNPSSPGAAPESLTTVLARPAENLVEPVLVAPRERPRQHPSALHDWSYANLLALDARLSREGNLKATPARLRLETQDATGHSVQLGTSPIEADGSFFVKTPADLPIRFTLLDNKGAVLRQEHGWFWIRRGEQRICVGCHTGPERASENNVPAVLLRSTTPTDLSAVPTPNAARQAEKGSR